LYTPFAKFLNSYYQSHSPNSLEKQYKRGNFMELETKHKIIFGIALVLVVIALMLFN